MVSTFPAQRGVEAVVGTVGGGHRFCRWLPIALLA